MPGLGTTPAYSVQEGNAGTIEVQINRPQDAAGLERAIEEHGIAADITYLPTSRSARRAATPRWTARWGCRSRSARRWSR